MDEKTNEILEIIQTIVDDKEKEKEKIILSPFWEGNLLESLYTEKDLHYNNRESNQFLSFRCKTGYIPLCCLTKTRYRNMGYTNHINQFYHSSGNFFSISYIPVEHRDYMIKLQSSGFDSMLLYGNFELISSFLSKHERTSKNFKEAIIQAFDRWMLYNPDDLYTIPKVSYLNYKSGLSIVKKSIEMPAFTYGQVTSASNVTKKYLIGHYFCGQIVDNVLQTVKPLYCLMVKKEYINYVKACVFANIKINPEALEMWIHEDMDNPKSENDIIRTRFNSLIKKKLQTDGVPIKVLSNITQELLNTPVKRIFNTLQERKEFVNEIIAKEIAAEKARLGIVDSPDKIDSVIESILNNISPTEEYPF